MSKQEPALRAFLEDLMYRRRKRPSQLAAVIGVSHATIGRWLSGRDRPSPNSRQKLARYSGLPLSKVFSLAGYLPPVPRLAPAEWPEFREYALLKYPEELDEDLIASIERLIESRRQKAIAAKNSADKVMSHQRP